MSIYAGTTYLDNLSYVTKLYIFIGKFEKYTVRGLSVDKKGIELVLLLGLETPYMHHNFYQ